ncbi:MAG: ABC transporter ATP-binding protein [Lachnospiraceae bacterium]|nr:ABC transporter ATP-binding protein [Lachnospiraceae bacterium]MCI9132883.1 ABC transporter ATP-binding protein [Lachnospiraceae bacterium]
MTDAVRVEGLWKSYGKKRILKGVDLQVSKGEIFALLGVNGAGKTTTLECMEGLRPYEEGRIALNGRMGIQLQSASLPGHMKGREALKLFAKWNRVSPDPAMLEALEIRELEHKQYQELSTGQKRRLHLALALLGNPDLVFLDEPTAGLDVEGRIALHEYIRKLKSQGKTIFLTSHDMAEVESLCDRIGILKNGFLVFVGTAMELTEKIGRHYQIHIKTQEGEETYESQDIGETLTAILKNCRERNVTIQDIRVDCGSLEEHFVKIAKEE